MVRIAYERYRTSFGGGLSKVAGQVFRIGHLGDCNEVMCLTALAAAEISLNDAGAKVDLGAGVAAAQTYYQTPVPEPGPPPSRSLNRGDPMSHTLHPLRRARLQRSELAVPGSNPEFIEKAATSAADYVFLDLEDAVAPSEKEQARKNVIAALHDIDWRGLGKTVSVRINGLDTHYMYRDVIDVMEQAGDRVDTLLVPKVGSARRPLRRRGPVNQVEQAKGYATRVATEALIETALGHGQRRGDRGQRRPAGGAALRRRRLRREQPGTHRQHRRPQPRLPRRPVALRAVAG